jgi:hypothetical protein
MHMFLYKQFIFIQFCVVGNLLLQGTIERIHIGNEYGDIPRGIYLVRGENVALCGEIVSKTVTVA